jgi:hypothetical protein
MEYFTMGYELGAKDHMPSTLSEGKATNVQKQSYLNGWVFGREWKRFMLEQEASYNSPGYMFPRHIFPIAIDTPETREHAEKRNSGG